MPNTQVRTQVDVPLSAEISAEIERLLDARTPQAAAQGPHFLELWELTAKCVKGGKLLRPRLLMGAFDALTGENHPSAKYRPAALEIAASLEILHFAFLLHDDIIDDDLMRRGEANVIGQLLKGSTFEANPNVDEESRLHWARSSGLLVGDLMLTVAHQLIARSTVPHERRIQILDLLDATVTETVAGEYYDVALSDGCLTPDLNVVLEMTSMKTATYTFELPLRIAAVIAGTSNHLEQLLGAAARHLGVAFQLQDDLLSAFGLTEAHGKDQFSDFREGKQTALVSYARRTPAWNDLEKLLGAPNFSTETGVIIQGLLIECGARDFIETMIQDQIHMALETLTQAPGVVPNELCQFILSLVDSLDGRRV